MLLKLAPGLQLRRGVEGLPAAATEVMSYYEKWAASVAAISMERGTIQQKDLDRFLGIPTEEPPVRLVMHAWPYMQLFCNVTTVAARTVQPQSAICCCRFSKGDVVRVRLENAAIRCRKPHLRTPGYIFGLIGSIERQCVGMADNPEALAFRQVGFSDLLLLHWHYHSSMTCCKNRHLAVGHVTLLCTRQIYTYNLLPCSLAA